MAELIGLPAPPAVGASALPAGTYADASVFVTGAGTGLGKAIASEFARLGAAVVIGSRNNEHLAAGPRGDGGSRRPGAHGAVRHSRAGERRGRVRRRDRRVRAARCARQQRRRELPGTGRGHVAECMAHGGGHHAQRHVHLLAASSVAGTSSRADPVRSSTSARPTRGPGVPASCTRLQRKPG